MKMRNGVLAAAAIVLSGLVAIAVPSASADTLTYNFTSCNVSDPGLCGASAGPYGSITTTLVGSEIKVVVTAAPGFAFFGQGGMLGFNVVGDLAGLGVNDASAGVGAFSTAQQYDGYGKFEGSVDGPVASSPLTTFSFDVARTAGFTTVTQLQELSTGGNSTFFAAHVIDTAGTGLGITGFSDASSVVPEPTSLLLAGSALVGLGFYARRKGWVKALSTPA
jgi:hypothetical protein